MWNCSKDNEKRKSKFKTAVPQSKNIHNYKCLVSILMTNVQVSTKALIDRKVLSGSSTSHMAAFSLYGPKI